MYVTAHRVRTQRHMEGINSYLYVHGGSLWRTPPDPDVEPGELLKSRLTVETVGGNLVRSYLDIVAPDAMWWSDVRSRLMQFLGSMRRSGFPWRGIVDQCLFQIGMDQQLSHAWQQEVTHLYQACEMVHHAA